MIAMTVGTHKIRLMTEKGGGDERWPEAGVTAAASKKEAASIGGRFSGKIRGDCLKGSQCQEYFTIGVPGSFAQSCMEPS